MNLHAVINNIPKKRPKDLKRRNLTIRDNSEEGLFIERSRISINALQQRPSGLQNKIDVEKSISKEMLCKYIFFINRYECYILIKLITSNLSSFCIKSLKSNFSLI